MSDQTSNDSTDAGEPASAADVVRGRMPLGLRIVGVLACLIVAAVFIGQVVEIFNKANKPLNTLNPQGENAQTIHNLVVPVFIVAGVVFIGVIGGVMLIAFKYRERPDEDENDFGVQSEGNTKLEIFWTLLPALVLAVIGFGTVLTIQKLDKPAPDGMKVDVFAQQWWWGFRYHIPADGQETTWDISERDVVTANELVIPAGRDVNLRETSNDVIHSYWIPKLNGKKDAVPGSFSNWKIQANQPGVYLGQCTEFCGLSHANMRMVVRALPEDEFVRWMENQRKPAVDLEKFPIAANAKATEGQKAFKQLLCSSCHLVRGINDNKVAGADVVDGKKQPGVKELLVSGVAPDLTHFASRGMFAGAIFNSHYPSKTNEDDGTYRFYEPTCSATQLAKCGDPRDVSLVGNPANPFYTPSLEAWLRNPPKVKPMAPTPEENPYANGLVGPENTTKGRGMPNLGLTEEQIDVLVAYLQTLK